MSAFDTAWRKGKEDATAKTLQEAYDQGDGDFNRFQRWFHVAEPIEVLMPNNDKPQPMERTHIGTNRLADEKGEYVGAEQAMADYQEDLQNLSRKRKNPKDPKYARIFIPNPESKIDEIGDFHIDEAHSDDWQEKLAGEPMTAFDRAWELTKAFPNMEYWHGTTADAARQILDEGLEAWSFGADDPDDPEMYSLDRMEARNEAPAMLAFDTTPEHTIHDPKEQGYDIGSEHGHWLVEEPVSPENVRLFAMGSKDMDGDEWIRFLDMLRAADRLSYRYPNIDEAYANRAVQKAWELIKAPFEINHPNDGKIKTIDRAPLYSGGDRIHDDFKYWTEDMDEALAYALYGSAVPNVEISDLNDDIPMRETYPAIKVMENPPDEYIPLMQDPQSQGYIDEFDEMGGEFMDEDELYAWIASMLPDYDLPPNEEKAAWKQWTYNDEGDEVAPRMVQPINPLGTTGWHHNDVARDEHMAGALNRLRDQMSGRIALPDDVLYRVETAETDRLKHMDFDEMLENWDYFDEREKDFIRRTKPHFIHSMRRL